MQGFCPKLEKISVKSSFPFPLLLLQQETTFSSPYFFVYLVLAGSSLTILLLPNYPMFYFPSRTFVYPVHTSTSCGSCYRKVIALRSIIPVPMDSTFGSGCLINYNRGKCPVTWDEKVMFLRGFGTHRFVIVCVTPHHSPLDISTPASPLGIQGVQT